MWYIVAYERNTGMFITELMLNNMPIVFNNKLDAVKCCCALNDGTELNDIEFDIRTIHGDKS